MNNSFFTQLTSIGVTTLVTFSVIPVIPAQANDVLQFICTQAFDKVTNQKVPTTYVWYQGEKRPVFRWIKNVGKTTPQERCNQISPRLQAAYDNGSLNIITNGKMNGQPVICTASQYGGDCDYLLMTLRPGDNSIAVLNEVKDSLSGRSMGPVRNSGKPNSIPQIYYEVNVKEAFRQASVD